MRWSVALALTLAACGAAPPGSDPGSDTLAPSPAGPAGQATAPPPGVTDAERALWHGRADEATEALLLRFWRGGSGYLASNASATDEVAYWNYAEAFEAVLDAIERTGGARFTGWAQTLFAAQQARGFSRDFYDDENWMALALLRGYDASGSQAMLDQAKTLYADIEAAWDTSCCGAHPGGVWWDRPHTQKATAANAGPVVTGVRLAARTGDAKYLAFAQQVYAYWRANMVEASGHVIDHIDPAGKTVPWQFTYNEGLMMGAALALHQATGDAQYLDDAQLYLGFMASHETRATPDGAVLFDGTDAQCGGDCMQFKGIAARFLGALDAAAPSSNAGALLAASAKSAWSLARTADDLFATDWSAAASGAGPLQAESSAVAALNAWAARLGPATPPPAQIYEAEEATVTKVGLEASHAGFGGWGYLAGWNGDGQSVTFRVHPATAGTHHLTLHYAAGAGNASRAILVDGKLATTQAFASTGSWDAWADASVDLALPAQDATITIAFDSAHGSSSYLNLDRLTLK